MQGDHRGKPQVVAYEAKPGRRKRAAQRAWEARWQQIRLWLAIAVGVIVIVTVGFLLLRAVAKAPPNDPSPPVQTPQ